MLTIAIVLLIIFGLGLILLEFFVVPGVTIAGIGGLLLMAAGVYLSYDVYGTPTGHYFFAGSLIASIIILYYVLSSDTWKKLGLKNSIESKVNTHEESDFKIGDQGTTITRINPMGKVEVNNKIHEAKSISGFIDEHSPIEIVKIETNLLIIKKL